MNLKRDEYYWVKLNSTGELTVAQYTGSQFGEWQLVGTEIDFKSDELTVIRRISKPKG